MKQLQTELRQLHDELKEPLAQIADQEQQLQKLFTEEHRLKESSKIKSGKRIQGKKEIYPVDVELDQLLTSFRLTLANLLAFLAKEILLEIFSKGSPHSKPRLRQNFASEVIAQRKNDHDQKQKKSRADEDPSEARAVAHVHEIEQHQQRLARRDGEREVNVQPAGVVKSHVDGD